MVILVGGCLGKLSNLEPVLCVKGPLLDEFKADHSVLSLKSWNGILKLLEKVIAIVGSCPEIC